MRTIISTIQNFCFVFFLVCCFCTVSVLAQIPRPDGNMNNRMPRGERIRENRPPNDTTQRPPFPRANRQVNVNNVTVTGNNGVVNAPLRNNEQGERNIQQLRNFDTNKNGIIEQNEMSDPQRRESIKQIVTQLGGNPNQPTININELAKRVTSSNRGTGTPPSPNLPSDPLVPYFGEKEAPRDTILQFGERSTTTNRTTVKNNTTAQTNQNNNKLTQARTILTQFDSNHNGTLDKDKGEWNGLSVDSNKADANKDGRISMDELVVVLGGSSNSGTPALVKVKPSIPYEHLPTGMPDWFFERDLDQDAQLTMLEYSNGAELNDAIAAEFMFLDKNNDGIATVDEIFKTLKQVDEEKQKQADLERREKELKLGNANIKNAGNSSNPNPNPIPNGNIVVVNKEGGNVVNTMPAQPTQSENRLHFNGFRPSSSGESPVPPTPPLYNNPPEATTNAPLNNWRPGSPIVAPTETPTNAPYAVGSPNTNNNSIRNNARNGGRTWNRESWNNRDRDRNRTNTTFGDRRNESRRGGR